MTAPAPVPTDHFAQILKAIEGFGLIVAGIFVAYYDGKDVVAGGALIAAGLAGIGLAPRLG